MKNMLNELRALTRYFTFWLIICFIDRFIFIISFWEKISGQDWTDILKIYYHGIYLDLSAVAYLSIIPFLVYVVLGFVPQVKLKRKVLDFYTLFLLVVYFAVSFININIYREWGDKISKRAIDAFWESPSGAVASAESTPVLVPIIGILSGIVFGYFLYRYLFKSVWFFNLKHNIPKLVLFVFGVLLLFTFIRGGYGRAPLNPSKAYFSENTFFNHAAVNTQWSLIRDYFTRSTLRRNPYVFFETEEQRKQILTPVFTHDLDSTQHILTTQRPNVVLIMLESFVGDLVASLGGEKAITPQLEKLIKEGVLFDRIYAASDRSDKGMVGVFSGFPAQGPESIIKYIPKHEDMPAIGQELDQAGYQTSFYHGGQSEFYNFKSYMLTHGIARVVDQANFGLNVDRASWGVYDHVIFHRMLKDLEKEKQPFFSTMFTLINHEPFELKGSYKFGKDSNANKFRSTAFYTDSVVYDFIEQAKKEAWYPNTLFILVADHGHRLPNEKWDLSNPNRFHIPLLFFGEVIKKEYRGTVRSNIGNQTDLAATLLTQLSLPIARYTWSRDLFNPTTTPVAFYNSKDAFGIITPNGELSFDNVGKTVNYKYPLSIPKQESDSLLNIAKSYYQQVYNDFLAY